MLTSFKNTAFTLASTTAWLDQFDHLLQEKPQYYNYNNKELARLMCVSERQLFRKMKSLTNLSPKQYLRQRRLQKAKEYLDRGDYQTVNEVAYSVGYENVGYFITQFQLSFGKRPLQLLKENGWR